MNEIILSIAIYAGIVFSLTTLMIVAKKLLLPSGKVAIRVNDQRDLSVSAGGKLLGALEREGIFVPSACGGAGTCGQCRVRLRSGGGYALPTELALIARADARAGWRLACQVPVREGLVVEVAPEILESRKWTCRVRSNRNVATFIKELILDLPAGEEVPFRAGGYIQTECPPHRVRYSDFDIPDAYRAEWERADMWRHVSIVDQPVTRAYSMANFPGEKGFIMLDVRIAPPPPNAPEGTPPGKMSSYLFSLRPGDTISIAGPFGEFFARESAAEMCFIGGGAGMAPMRSHIFDQLERLHTERTITFWYGARSLCEAFYQEDFDRLDREHDNFTWHLALSEPLPEDRWAGLVGFIHRVVQDNHLKDHPAPEDIEYYLCGPPVMAQAVVSMLDDLGVPPENIFFDDFGS
ncbi:MAG: NADH:ubiquinone reductase (Na(+)-transporting) subunit F [Deltaproteobacteria bacterium]|nr:NADH:ubiquinone reductase (Na(+)-transporting) subunit F [Deltaproteobacteria bacterium]